MGGDDLNDEFLWATEPVVATEATPFMDNGRDDASASSTDRSKKRKNTKSRSEVPTTDGATGGNGNQDDLANREQATNNNNNSNKKRKCEPTREQFLLLAGRNVARQDCVQQATFLTTALQHYTLLEQRHSDQPTDHDTVVEKLTIFPAHCVGGTTTSTTANNNNTTTTGTLLDHIRRAISVPKMKKWKHTGSPCVVRTFVCMLPKY